MSEKQARLERFQRFIAANAVTVAGVASDGFRDRGPGLVVVRVSGLEGGDRFDPAQPDGVSFEYWSKAELKKLSPRDRDTEAALGRCSQPDEAVILALYPDGRGEGARVNIAGLAGFVRRTYRPADPSGPPAS